jgi:hypothetical protein
MNTSEQSLPLTETERRPLSGKRMRALIMAPVSLLLLLMLVGFIVAQVLSLFLVTLVLFSLVTGVPAILSTIKFIKLNRGHR